MRPPRWSTSSRGRWPARALLDRVDAGSTTSPANPAAKRYVREGRADVVRALAAQARDARLTPSQRSTRRRRASAATRRAVAACDAGAAQLLACRVRRPGVLGEHADAALEAADEVAGGERGLHLEHGEMDLVVVERAGVRRRR